ncbi:MAG: response regulator transcription factor [Bacteroidales bacterium]|nr:response regulator transcription factor [Bacteroidales bacterium]
MDKILKILIVEDHPLTRMGIKLSVSRNFPSCEIVGEKESVKDTLFFLHENPTLDLVLLDITLTDGSSMPIAQYIKQNMPQTKILVCSMNSSYMDIVGFVELGVDGFISKFSDESVFASAITTVIDNESFFGKDISQIIAAVGNANNDLNFTERERQIIQLCAAGKRVKAIAEELKISKRTVEAHKANIFNKSGLKSTAEIVKYALEKGIITL